MALPQSRLARVLILLFGVGVVAAGVGAVVFWITFMRDLPDLHNLRDYEPRLSSHVYDRHGRLIAEYFDERRTLVPMEEIPRHTVVAFVAGEDGKFFEHSGLDFQGILRAAWVNLIAGGEIVQGGSTITQQVAKTLLLTPERRYTRKVKDMLLARRIEQRFSKEEILYLYLNQIYFGHGAYGLGEAARRYYGKLPSELSVSESALLAGLPKAPSSYSPYRNPEAAERRRLYVLRRMQEEGYLDAAAHDAAVADVPVVAPPPDYTDFEAAAYFTEEVRRDLFARLGGEVVRQGGLVIETTLDVDLQREAVEAVQKGLRELDRRQGYRGHVRHVGADAVAAEIERLGGENELDDADTWGEDGEVPSDSVLLGVITAVDPSAKEARVAFGPQLSGRVILKDVSWARKPDPRRSSHPVRQIESIFAVGDVTRFTRVPDTAGDERRFTLHQEPAVQGSLVCLDVDSGEVRALVGGYDFAQSEFDRALQARRQPGSAFKPIIYATALSEGYTPASIVVDRPIVYEDEETGFTWRPENYEREFMGPMTLRTALARSVNNATIHLLEDVGVGDVMAMARRLGIESPLDRNLSLALGVSGVSLLELTRAYGVFPAGGRLEDPRYVTRVLDKDGNVLLENLVLGAAPMEPAVAAGPEGAEGAPEEEVSAEAVRVVSGDADAADAAALPEGYVMTPTQAFLMTDMLKGVVFDPHGTGRRAQDLKRPIGGKTGTTNEQADAWFIGFSPDLTVGVWTGFDERRVLGFRETGARAALPIWRYFMQAAHRGKPRRDFPVPPGIVFARVDRATGLLVGPSSKEPYFQPFLEGTEPTETAERAQNASERDRLLRLDAF